MEKAKVFGAFVKGTWTEIKAYKKINAVRRFKQLDPNVNIHDVAITTSINSEQAPVEELYPDICV